MPQPPIAILGAGPGGLMLARLLELKGIDYSVFERDAFRSERPQGGSLDIHVGSGQLAVKEAGLWDDFLKIARYDAPTIMTDKNGKVVLRMDPQPGEGVFDRPEVDRSALRNLLLDSIPESKVQWGKQVSKVAKDTDGTMSVHFRDGPSASGFRLVVGADGARSKARSMVTTSQPNYCGLVYLATSVDPSQSDYPKVVALANKGMYGSIGTGKMLTLQYTGDGLYNMYIGLKLPETWETREKSLLEDPPALRRWLVEGPFSDWAQSVTDVIRNSEGNFRVWSLCSMPLESMSWESVPGVTLVGDAAHVTYPNGEGVNHALFDSFQLAQSIGEFGLDALGQAVAGYEKSMFPRAREHIQDGLNTREMMFGANAPDEFAALFAAGTAEEEGKITHGQPVAAK